jgi:AraC-like DNA-binding protein
MLDQGIPLAWALRHCVGTSAQGIPTELILERSLVVRRFGDDKDRVSLPQLGLIWFNAALAVEDEAAGLGSRRIPAGVSTLAIHTMLGCATLGRAILSIIRLYDFAAPVKFALRVDGNVASLLVHSDERSNGSNALIIEEIFLTFLFGCLSFFLGRPLPHIYQTRDRCHTNLNGTHWSTFAPVRLGPVAALRFPKRTLAANRVAPATDDVYWEMLYPWLALYEAMVAEAENPWVTLGDLRLDVLAREAGVSISTVRREMTSTRGGFRRVRRKLLVDAGLQLLSSSSRSVESIAAQLGYSDARAFRRFFKTATGKTPDAFRSEESYVHPEALNPAFYGRFREVAHKMIAYIE